MTNRKKKVHPRDVPSTGAASVAQRKKARLQPRFKGKFVSAHAVHEADLNAQLAQERSLRMDAEERLETLLAESRRRDLELEQAYKVVDKQASEIAVLRGKRVDAKKDEECAKVIQTDALDKREAVPLAQRFTESEARAIEANQTQDVVVGLLKDPVGAFAEECQVVSEPQVTEERDALEQGV